MSSQTILGSINVTNSMFIWQIPNFSTIKAGECMYSPTFVTTHQSSSKIIKLHWRISPYLSGKKDESYVSVFLQNLDVASDLIEVTTAFSIVLTSNLTVNHAYKLVPSDESLVIFNENSTNWGWIRSETRDSILKQCSITDTLTFSCHIYLTSVKCNDPELDERNRSKALMNHFDILFNTGQFSDMTISIENKKLHVHKNIVTSLSPVFRAMFENQMREQNENVVEIVDVEFDVMKEMLRYIYIGKVYGIEKIASDLLKAADKYYVYGLKSLCEQSLRKNLNKSNALQILEIAGLYKEERFKQGV